MIELPESWLLEKTESLVGKGRQTDLIRVLRLFGTSSPRLDRSSRRSRDECQLRLAVEKSIGELISTCPVGVITAISMILSPH